MKGHKTIMEPIHHRSSSIPSESFAQFWLGDTISTSGYGIYLLLSKMVTAIKHCTFGRVVKHIPVAHPSLPGYVKLQPEDTAAHYKDAGNLASSTKRTREGYTLFHNEEAANSSSVSKNVTFSKKKTVIRSSPKLRVAAQRAEKPMVRQPSVAFLPTTGVPFLHRMKIGTSSGLSLEKLEKQTQVRLSKVPAAIKAVKAAATPQQFQHATISLQSLSFLLRRVFDRLTEILITDSNRNAKHKLTDERHEALSERCYELESQMREARTLLNTAFVESDAALRKLLNEQIKLVEARTTILKASMVSGKEDLSVEQTALLTEMTTLIELIRRSKALALDYAQKMQLPNKVEAAQEAYSLMIETLAQAAKFLGRANNLLPQKLKLTEFTVDVYTKHYVIASTPLKNMHKNVVDTQLPSQPLSQVIEIQTTKAKRAAHRREGSAA